MSFRRPRADPHRKLVEAWLREIWPTLREIGVAPEVVRDADHWEDFLENGHLHWTRPTSGFHFRELNAEQMVALLDVLEQQYGVDAAIPLLRWLRLARLADFRT